MNEAGSPHAGLRRRVSMPLLVLYGLGTTVGAGVYALVGEVAGLAGMLSPLAFGLAAAVAALTALTFAELSSRHPRAAGEAEYTRRAFGRPALALTVGLAVAAAGVISAGAMANGFAGYWSSLLLTPRGVSITLFIATLGAVAAWGVKESLWVAAAFTLVEVGGLLVIVAVAGGELTQLGERWAAAPAAPWVGVLSAGTLALYAFLGFEDMVNVAEEVKEVRRTLPRAIVWTLVLTTLLYLAISFVSVAAVPPGELAASEAPLALVYERAVGRAPVEMALIGTIAMVNGALIQIIMSARVLYGLADQGALPASLRRVNRRTGTPLVATILVSTLIWALAMAFPLAGLARGTALIALSVFGLMHAALWVLKRRGPAPEGAFHCPAWVPPLGLFASVGLLGFEIWSRVG